MTPAAGSYPFFLNFPSFQALKNCPHANGLKMFMGGV
jgi:hypothetical protein